MHGARFTDLEDEYEYIYRSTYSRRPEKHWILKENEGNENRNSFGIKKLNAKEKKKGKVLQKNA